MSDSTRQSLATLDETCKLAQDIAQLVQPPMTIGLVGTLGAGKTQLARFLVAAMGGPEEAVTSPTYVLAQSYSGRCKIHHFDFYRLDTSAEVWDLGIDELFEQPVLVLVEWADKFPACLPDDRVTINLSLEESSGRWAEVLGGGVRSSEIVANLPWNSCK